MKRLQQRKPVLLLIFATVILKHKTTSTSTEYNVNLNQCPWHCYCFYKHNISSRGNNSIHYGMVECKTNKNPIPFPTKLPSGTKSVFIISTFNNIYFNLDSFLRVAEWQNVVNLKMKRVYGLTYLHSKTFMKFISLEHLAINSCNLRFIEYESFKWLTKLETLDLSYNPLLKFYDISNGLGEISFMYLRAVKLRQIQNHNLEEFQDLLNHISFWNSNSGNLKLDIYKTSFPCVCGDFNNVKQLINFTTFLHINLSSIFCEFGQEIFPFSRFISDGHVIQTRVCSKQDGNDLIYVLNWPIFLCFFNIALFSIIVCITVHNRKKKIKYNIK